MKDGLIIAGLSVLLVAFAAGAAIVAAIGYPAFAPIWAINSIAMGWCIGQVVATRDKKR